jgi:cytochrome c-type biogenesis protein CcmF
VVYAGQNPDTGRPIIKVFLNPLVAWIWIGVVVVVFGTLTALVPNLSTAWAANRIHPRVHPAAAGASLAEEGLHAGGAD